MEPLKYRINTESVFKKLHVQIFSPSFHSCNNKDNNNPHELWNQYNYLRKKIFKKKDKLYEQLGNEINRYTNYFYGVDVYILFLPCTLDFFLVKKIIASKKGVHFDLWWHKCIIEQCTSGAKKKIA